jgi:hypothetical protein
MALLQANIDLDGGPGTIQYKAVDTALTSVEDIKGVFVTTFYFHDKYEGQDQPWTKTDIYKKGILHMLSVTDDPAFAGWKLIIYTDQISLETPYSSTTTNLEMHKQEWEIIKTHKNTIFAIIDSTDFAVGDGTDTKTIDNAIIRAFRMRAFHDFHNIPVMIRDADTLFENIVKILDGGRPAKFKEEMITWEKTFLENLKTKPAQTLVIASQPNYHRQWHVDPATGVSTTGCYAAVTSTLGNIDEWKNGSLWRKCFEYLKKNTKIENVTGTRKPKNISLPTYIGKDEQLLSYVIIPEILNKVHFYYLEYIQVEGVKIQMSEETPFADKVLDSHLFSEPRYPSPYIQVLGEALPELEGSAALKRKDENVKTEETILKPEIIPLSFSPITNRLMHIIFEYYVDKMKRAAVTTLQGGGRTGGKKTRRRYKKRQDKKRPNKRYSRK